jgi:glycine/serine hydroxymethyltransferase
MPKDILKRYYGGCEVVDIVEQIAIDRAKALLALNTQMCNPLWFSS